MTKSILIVEQERPADLDVYRRGIAEVLPDLDLRFAGTEAEALAQCADCTAVAAKAQYLSAPIVAAMPRLDWVQALTTGTDPLDALRLPAGLTITSVRGIHAPQMAELAFLMMLALTRDLPGMLAAQAEARWQRRPQPLLAGKMLLLVGIGLISEGIALRCAAFGMRVTGASATRTYADGFERVYSYHDLGDAVAAADIVVVVTPYSPKTHHLVDAGILGRMRETALLINIARGGVVDEHALIVALRERGIAGAGLDVFATEPLPSDSPLWLLPNVILTPHIGGMSDSYAEQVLPIFITNLRAYRAGLGAAGMTNVVRRADHPSAECLP